MTDSRSLPKCTTLASAFVLLVAPLAHAGDGQAPLPIYIEDDHAGAFAFLAETVDLVRPHTLLLVDAHPDSSIPQGVERLRDGLRRVASPEQRRERIESWRRDGSVQSFDWIAALMPSPISRVLWVRIDGSATPPTLSLPSEFVEARVEDLPRRVPLDLPVVASIDLDAFSGLAPDEQTATFSAVWERVISVPRLEAVTFAISRPWLLDDAEASRLVRQALRAGLELANAAIRFEPYGIEGPDLSERAKLFYRRHEEPPRFDPDNASPELRSLLVANADALDVRLDPGRWRALLERWRAEDGVWHLSLAGVQADSDGVARPVGDTLPELRVEGGLPGRIRRVTWLAWTPSSWSYNVLPELPAGKVFVGAAPPVIEYRPTVIARTSSLSLGPEEWAGALPGPDHSGVLRVSAELETDVGIASTARFEIRRGVGSGFHAGLSEQFGSPYVFGAGFLRRGALRGPDTGVGNDCANFLVYAWRRSGLRVPWSNPAQLRRHLVPVAAQVGTTDRVVIPGDAAERGLVIHLGSHVAALWEDRAPEGTLGPEDLVVHHLGGAPEILSLGALLAGRATATFDLYLGPERKAVAWVAVGGDVMPGTGAPPAGVRERLRRADLAVANLETTVGEGGQAAPKQYAYQTPSSRLADLLDLGLGGVSVANNHAGDYAADGLRQTLSGLDKVGLGHFGAGENASAAAAPWITRVNGVRVGFVAVTLADSELPARPASPGVAALPRLEREVAEALAAARASLDCVIVVPHWGREGTTTVTDDQHRWARWLVEHGADAVVGSGPHVVQGHETIAGVPVYYSAGNLWFSGRWPAELRTAGVVMLGLDSGGRVVASRLERVPAQGGDGMGMLPPPR
jgi:poly-gamma-glutamate capsule biosynthesis protein CapA/YwtB (metallophosphatase superfamily)